MAPVAKHGKPSRRIGYAQEICPVICGNAGWRSHGLRFLRRVRLHRGEEGAVGLVTGQAHDPPVVVEMEFGRDLHFPVPVPRADLDGMRGPQLLAPVASQAVIVAVRQEPGRLEVPAVVDMAFPALVRLPEEGMRIKARVELSCQDHVGKQRSRQDKQELPQDLPGCLRRQ